MVGYLYGREYTVWDKDLGVIYLEVKIICVVNLNEIVEGRNKGKISNSWRFYFVECF